MGLLVKMLMEEVWIYTDEVLPGVAGVELSIAGGTTCRKLLQDLKNEYGQESPNVRRWKLREEWNGCSK